MIFRKEVYSKNSEWVVSDSLSFFFHRFQEHVVMEENITLLRWNPDLYVNVHFERDYPLHIIYHEIFQ